MQKISVTAIKRIILSCLMIASIIILYRTYNKIFYYTNQNIQPFSNLTYHVSKSLDIPDGIWLHRGQQPGTGKIFFEQFFRI